MIVPFPHIRARCKELCQKYSVLQSYTPSLIFIFSLFFVQNNKMLAIDIAVFTVFLSIMQKNIASALLLAFLTVLPFQKGISVPFEFFLRSDMWSERFPYILSVGIYFSDIIGMLFIYFSLKNSFSKKSHPAHAQDYFLFLFLLFSFISAFFSPAPSLSLAYSLKFCLLALLYRGIKKVPFQTIFSLLLISAVSITIFEGSLTAIQLLKSGKLHIAIETQNDSNQYDQSERTAVEDKYFFRPEGTFSDPNFLALYVSTFLPMFAFLLILRSTHHPIRILSAFSGVFGILSLLLSSSRISWLASGLSLTGIILYLKNRKVAVQNTVLKYAFIAVTGISIVLFPTILLPRLLQIPITLQYGGGVTYRWDFIEKTIDIIMKYPLGIGLGMFPIVHFQELGGSYSFPAEAHNVFAQVLGETGILGFLCFFLFIFSSIRQSLVRLKEHSQYSMQRIMLFFSFSTYLFLSLFYPTLMEFPLISLLFILTASLEAQDAV